MMKERLAMMKQHWVLITIVVGFAIVLFLVVRDDVLYKQESAKPQKLTTEEREAFRKKEKSLRYQKAYKPQLQEKSAKAEARKLAEWKANFPWKPSYDATLKFDPLKHFSTLPTRRTAERRKWKLPNNEDSEAGTYHMRLKNFFQDEDRFSRQFQQVYEILHENGRGHNPALVVAVFRELRRYKHALTIPEDVQRTFRGRTREEHIDGYYTNIYAVLTDSS